MKFMDRRQMHTQLDLHSFFALHVYAQIHKIGSRIFGKNWVLKLHCMVSRKKLQCLLQCWGRSKWYIHSFGSFDAVYCQKLAA